MSFPDIAAWSELSGVELELWEIETIRFMSSTYVGSLQKYQHEDNKNIDPPYMTQITHEFRQEQYVKQRLRDVEEINKTISANSANTTIVKQTNPTKYKTKADHARSVISKDSGMSKSELIGVFVSECEMSPSYAKTFYRDEVESK